MPQTHPLKHLAIIMDGNGRWATSQGLSRIDGHRRGAETTLNIIDYCRKSGIHELSLYALSLENLKRPDSEVSFLTNLIAQLCLENQEKLHQQGICIKIIGSSESMARQGDLGKMKHAVEALTMHNTGMRLNILINYSGRWEIQQVFESLQTEGCTAKGAELTKILKDRLLQGMTHEPDLCIRTGGEQRLSNFMLWQLAYTELYFTDVLWPAFSVEDLEASMVDYRSRKRRFGVIEEVAS